MTSIAERVATTGQLLVRSGIEIDRILTAIVQDHATVSANLPSQIIFLSRLLEADPVKQRVILAHSDYKVANAALLAASSVTLKCHHRWAHFAFSCTRPRPVTHAGQAAVEMESPTMMLALQHHRSVARGQVTKEAPDLRCQLPMGTISLEARLVDMSLDGHAFLLGDRAIPVCAGTWVRGARITPQGAGPLLVDIDVKHVIPTILPDGERATRIGCRIVAPELAMEKLVASFVVNF